MKTLSLKKKAVFLIVNVSVLLISLLGCQDITSSNYVSSNSSEQIEPKPDYGVFSKNDFLKVSGTKIKKDYGKGDSLILRGTNAGGYLVIEQWMCAVKGSEKTGYLDHKKMTDVFVEKFGKEKTLQLWEYYRENYWTDYDFDNCAKMGMNVIRLPFSYMSVDPEFNNVREIKGQKYNFSILDDFVSKAAQYGIYTILDMHGAYGSQNGQDHSGQTFSSADQVDFYENSEKKAKTVALWKAIANHFKDNPAVAGYDILNEPGEKAGSTTKKHWDFFDEVYDAIREVDNDHVVIFESCWDGVNLPQPSEYGWQNCMYSFHNYSGETDADKNLASMQNKINGVEKMNFNVPFYMGEFNCYGSADSWKQTLSYFNSKGWHWTSWTYKLNRKTDAAYPGWGIYYSRAELVVPDEDTYDSILEKWYRIDTAYETVEKMRFNETETLEKIMAKFCQQ